MTKAERVEDLGRIREMLSSNIDQMEEKYGRYLHSKHSYEEFEKFIKDDKDGSIYDLHVFLRFHLEKLYEIYSISQGDIE